jgi:eukaryotic-like serine/threonine-protein kinase
MSRGEEPQATVEQVMVPSLANLEQTAAEQAITDAGLEVGTVTVEPSTTVAEGLVIRSSPASGAQVQQGSTVDLFVSGGPDTLTVPNVVGLDEQRAVDTLEKAGFTSVNTQQVESLEAEGKVVAVSPEENAQAAPNAPIRLQISTGTVKLPDVKDRSESEARKVLTEAGFSASQIVNQNAERDDVPAGTVVGTEPGAGTAVGAGEEIVLLIAVPTPPAQTSTSPSSATETPTGTGSP